MTNALTTLPTNTNEPLTMSSREIAELTGKEHKHVMRDIRDMLEELEEDESKFGHIYLDAYQREKPCFNLPKDLTITLISGYNVKMRHAITQRWMELEAAKTPAIPQTYAAALMAAAQAEMAKEVLQLENAKKDAVIVEQAEALAIAAPKAEFYDTAVDCDALYLPSQIASMLNLREYRSAQKVNELLERMKWQRRQQCGVDKNGKPQFKWVPTAFANENGYMTVRTRPIPGQSFTKNSPYTSPKGYLHIRHQVGLGLSDEHEA